MRYLIDSDWLIDVFIGVPRAVRLLQEHRPEGISLTRNVRHFARIPELRLYEAS
jgi:predicted nucleic acid-binding protein